MKALTLPLVALFALLFASCSPRVGVTGSWQNPDVKTPNAYSKVFVTSMMHDELTARKVEDGLADALTKSQVTSSKGYYIFPDMYRKDSNPSKEDILAKINEGKHTAILTVSAFDVEKETQYIPDTRTVYTPTMTYANAGNFWGFYSYYRPRVYQNGYYSEEKVYYVEVNLFDAKTDKLIWSIQTKTYNPRDLGEFSQEFAETVVKELKNDGMI